MSIENLKTFDPFAEADEDTGQVKQSQQDYIHIRIQRTLFLASQPRSQTVNPRAPSPFQPRLVPL
jgi:hypothetical protein